MNPQAPSTTLSRCTPSSVPLVFTVGQIAERLGQDRSAVRMMLAAADASQARPSRNRGQPAQGWPVSALPAPLLERLGNLADEHCYGRDGRDIERFLAQGRRRWTPRVPIARLPQSQIELARRRCNTLAPVMRERCNQPVADIVAAGMSAWTAGGGYRVTERTLRRWIERAQDRDLGFNEWDRWEIWLDAEVTTVATAPDPTAAQILDAPRLEEMISKVAQPAALTKLERERIWAAAMNDASALVTAGSDEATAQRTVLRMLSLSGLAMAKNANALRTTYRRKRAAWLSAGGRLDALADKRKRAALARKFSLPMCDFHCLLQLARTCGNQLSSAYREAHRRKLLSGETLARFPTLPADKSFVPHTIRRAVAPFLGPVEVNGRGPRARRLNGAPIECDWSTVQPGDVFEFDDLTLPLCWWREDPTRPEGFYFGQGQVLAGVDSKTGFILSWILIARSGYNSRDIIQLVREVHDAYGLPRQYLLFEMGIWKNARLINGSPSERAKEQICDGLGSIWPVRHTHTPTGKAIIERTFGLMQDRMEHIPGYCGRDMRKDCPQATKRAMDDVKAGRAHPSKYFLHADQVMALLEDIADEINNEPLGLRTKRIPGQSPRQAFDTRDLSSMQYFGPEADHLFKTHRLERRVTTDGIRLPESLDGAVYRNAATGPLLGQSVLCWVDPLDLSSIFITDLDGHNPQLVERAEQPAARGADAASLAKAWRQCSEHMRFVDVLTRTTKPKLRPADFRPMVTDGASRRLGEAMDQQKHEHRARQRENASLAREFARLTERHGLHLAQPQDPARLRDMVQSLNAGAEDWREIERQAKEDIEL
ncbi:MAG: Mu transposase C-terminal domain-containing protein [Opitutaceae bacterium]|nr:Mu transposase C-terminal domain-containing protein [Opitutaceae bacterium]